MYEMGLSQLPESIQCRLQKNNLDNIDAVVSISKTQLQSLLPNEEKAVNVKSTISSGYLNRFIKASECTAQRSHSWKRLSFGCKTLDTATRHGIPTRGITEISGESSSGKTQICLQLCLTVQLAEECGGLAKGAVFISTEEAFPAKRLHQIASGFGDRFESIAQTDDFLNNIYIEHISETDELLDCVSKRLPVLMAQKQIGLIVIDSVAAIFRLETDILSRSADMRRLAHSLQRLSDEYGCAIVCINQVTSIIDNSSENKLIPCLGLTWSNLVTNRFQIHRANEVYKYHAFDENDTKIEEIVLTVRKFDVIFSPELPSTSCEFLITPEGITDIPS